MTIKLRPETLKALEPEIVKVLERTEVTKGNLTNLNSSFSLLWAAEDLLPKTGPVRQQLNQYVGERSLVTFIADELRVRVNLEKYDPDKESQPLLEALSTKDPLPLAKELLDSLQSLPRSYWATLLLPDSLSEFVTLLPPIHFLGPSVRLVHEPEMMKLVAPANALSGALNSLSIFAVAGQLVNANDSRAALQVQVDGFVPRFGGGETVDEAHGLFKSFFGLGLAIGLFKAPDFPNPQSGRLGMQFHLGEPKGGESVSTIPLTDAETTAMAGLSYAGRVSPDRQDLAPAFGRLSNMEVIFCAPAKHQLLLRASRWLFDSYVTEDPLLSFVQATVVLEILLGDKATTDEVGLTTLLANRCAYMIGATTSERSVIIKNFKALYGTRSQIVHSGKHRLSGSEQFQLHQLRSLGRRVICAEMELALEEIRRERVRAARRVGKDAAAPKAKKPVAPVAKAVR